MAVGIWEQLLLNCSWIFLWGCRTLCSLSCVCKVILIRTVNGFFNCYLLYTGRGFCLTRCVFVFFLNYWFCYASANYYCIQFQVCSLVYSCSQGKFCFIFNAFLFVVFLNFTVFVRCLLVGCGDLPLIVSIKVFSVSCFFFSLANSMHR